MGEVTLGWEGWVRLLCCGRGVGGGVTLPGTEDRARSCSVRLKSTCTGRGLTGGVDPVDTAPGDVVRASAEHIHNMVSTSHVHSPTSYPLNTNLRVSVHKSWNRLNCHLYDTIHVHHLHMHIVSMDMYPQCSTSVN